MTQVLGYVMAKNAWPLLGIAILNAFNLGVSHIIVVNHNSEDDTDEGLSNLSNYFQDKITIINNSEKFFLQEKTAREVLGAFDLKPYDWIYIFDADEIMMLRHHNTLPELLETIPENFKAVRYEIDQWVWTRGLDDKIAADYSKILFKAKPIFEKYNFPEDIAERAMHFFSIPFPSKVLVRSELADSITVGSHSVYDNSQQLRVSRNTMVVGHIPFRSTEQLKRKSKHGSLLIDAGFPDWHGWQSKAMFKLDLSGRLDEFWQKNTVSSENTKDFVLDDSLSIAIKKCLDLNII